MSLQDLVVSKNNKNVFVKQIEDKIKNVNYKLSK